MDTEFLIDDREIINTDCSEGDQQAGCYCNCHSSGDINVTPNIVDALKADDLVNCDDVGIQQFAVCDGVKEINFSSPSEPSLPKVRHSILYKCELPYQKVADKCLYTSETPRWHIMCKGANGGHQYVFKKPNFWNPNQCNAPTYEPLIDIYEKALEPYCPSGYEMNVGYCEKK